MCILNRSNTAVHRLIIRYHSVAAVH